MKKGFTLLEALIAVAIVSVIIFVLFNQISPGIINNINKSKEIKAQIDANDLYMAIQKAKRYSKNGKYQPSDKFYTGSELSTNNSVFLFYNTDVTGELLLCDSDNKKVDEGIKALCPNLPNFDNDSGSNLSYDSTRDCTADGNCNCIDIKSNYLDKGYLSNDISLDGKIVGDNSKSYTDIKDTGFYAFFEGDEKLVIGSCNYEAARVCENPNSNCCNIDAEYKCDYFKYQNNSLSSK